MYVNCQLPAPGERAGEYPSGGPHPYYLEIYRVTAPTIDFYSPDIYWPNFEYWIDRYRFSGNAVFVPEARLESAPYNAFYAYGEAGAFGFSPFGIENAKSTAEASGGPTINEVYEALSSLSDVLLAHQASNGSRGVVLHSNSPRPTRTAALGDYLFEATLSRSWPAKTLLTDDGAMIIVESTRDEFYIAGTGLTVTFFRNPDIDNAVGRIESIEEVSRSDEKWSTRRRLNGDQTNQGRQLLMPAHQVRVYRVVLYATARNAQSR